MCQVCLTQSDTGKPDICCRLSLMLDFCYQGACKVTPSHIPKAQLLNPAVRQTKTTVLDTTSHVVRNCNLELCNSDQFAVCNDAQHQSRLGSSASMSADVVFNGLRMSIYNFNLSPLLISCVRCYGKTLCDNAVCCRAAQHCTMLFMKATCRLPRLC